MFGIDIALWNLIYGSCKTLGTILGTGALGGAAMYGLVITYGVQLVLDKNKKGDKK